LREDLSLQLRYSLYQQEITLPAGTDTTYISYPILKELTEGAKLTSMVGYTLTYNTLDNNKNPTDGLLIDWKQDFAGVGGDVSYFKSTIDAKYYTPLVSDIVGIIRLQGGILNKVGNNEIRMLDHFQMGPNLVRGFAPNGIGPRDISTINQFGYGDALGGTQYWGASVELQMPFWFLPKEVGLKGAIYADAGQLTGYKGPPYAGQAPDVDPILQAKRLAFDPYSDSTVRSSVGVGLIWQSPFGPLRFDYAIPLTKGKYDRVQEFRFGGGTTF